MPKRLRHLALNTTRPGFYDEPAFLDAEKLDRTLLEAYAGFVEQRQFDSGYEAYARERVQVSTSFLLERLLQDGRKGACVDLSQVLSRFLERQGVWNYMVTGAVTLRFSRHTRIRTKHFWPVSSEPSPAAAAHAWLRVPPFKVVDLTLGLQDYESGEGLYLQEPVLDDAPAPGNAELDDLMDPGAREELRRSLGRSPTLEDVPQFNRGLLQRIRLLGVWTVRRPDVEIRYVGCAVSAPDGPLDSARNLCLNGRYPADLWKEFEAATKPPSDYRL